MEWILCGSWNDESTPSSYERGCDHDPGDEVPYDDHSHRGHAHLCGPAPGPRVCDHSQLRAMECNDEASWRVVECQ